MQRGDDPDDIYNLRARKGNHVTITIEPEPSPYGTGTVDAIAWLPGTANVSKIGTGRMVTSTIGTGSPEHLSFTATRNGTWPIEVLAHDGWTAYRLSWSVAPSNSSGATLRK